MIVNIIHCPDRKDRHELLLKEIEQQKFEYRIWECIKKFPKPKQNIREAHLQVVRWAKENSQEEVIIMEDDCHWVVPGAFDYYISKKPISYDLYLSSVMWGRLNADNTINDYAGNQGYMIHQRYYNTYLESDPNRDIDRAQKGRGIFKVCNPFATMQAETLSDNTKKIHRQAKLYLNKVIYNGSNG